MSRLDKLLLLLDTGKWGECGGTKRPWPSGVMLWTDDRPGSCNGPRLVSTFLLVASCECVG
jgi:hypothetical protein